MSDPLQLKIILPEATVPPRPIKGIDVPATDGRLTVLSGHQPLIVALVKGNAIITAMDGTRESWTISAGALQMEDNTAVLLVTKATLEGDRAESGD